MRRLVAVVSAGVLVLALCTPAVAGGSKGAQVVHANLPCAVGWDNASWTVGSAGGCDVQNVKLPNGGFTEVLHGQIPADQMAAFRAAGSPSKFATQCLVNYGILYTADPPIPVWGPFMVFTPSVRHFTPDGKMTEVCSPSH